MLSGQTAIVTGGSRGIDRAICLALAGHGARVAFCHADGPQAANAGMLKEAPLSQTTTQDFDRVIAVNVRGTFLASRAFVRYTDSGRIINIASDLGVLGREDMIAYSASKGAIISMARTRARELAPHILANSVAPGSVATDMTKPDAMSPEALAKDLATPLARFGEPDEIAFMVAFLAGPESKFITGQCFGVNGGSVMQ